MPTKPPPPLPDVDDLPEIEADEDYSTALPSKVASSERMSAEAEVSDTIGDICAKSFEDAPEDRPLDFDDGEAMGWHK